MNNEKQRATYMRWLGSGVVMLGLIAPLAVAGPEEDFKLAVKQFEEGDLISSMALWRKGAEAGYAPAQVWLGEILDKAEEDEEAVSWYRKAAAAGSVAGEYGLGTMYAKGEGVPKDLAKAQAMILKAAEKGHVPAVAAMMVAYRSGGLGLAADPAQADAWEEKLVALDPSYKKNLPVTVVTDKARKAENK